MGSNKKHRTSQHQDRKTTTTKRNKAWSQLSSWDGEVSDEESDFIDFCRTKGLARSSSQRTPHTNGKAAETLSNKVSSTSFDLDLYKDSKYISSLCSFLTDKIKFFRESEYQTVEISNQEQDGDKRKHGVDESDVPTEIVSIVNKQSDENKTSNTLLSASSLGTIRKLSNSILNRNSDKAPNHSFPIIHLRKEVKPAMQCGSPDEDTVAMKNKDLTHYSDLKFRQVLFRRSSREWAANIETDIMKLYEQAETAPIVQIQDQVEATETKTNHTPSYVLALANLFRRRMQLRKEYSQELGDMAGTAVNGSAIKPQDWNDLFPLPSTDFTTSSQPESGANYFNKKLLHRHMATDRNFFSTQPSNGHSTPRASLQPSSDYSPSLPQLPDKMKPEEIISETIKTKIRVEPTTERSTASKLVKSSAKSSKTPEGLEELLIVFPKATQRKFSGVQSTPEPSKTHSPPCADSLNRTFSRSSSSVLKPGSQSQHQDALHSHKSFKRAKTTTAKSTSRDSSQTTARFSKETSCKPRSYTSASSYSQYSHLAPKLSIAHRMTNNNSIARSDSKVANKPKHISCENSVGRSVNIALIPISSVRWSGSLGTLYRKRGDKLDKSVRPNMASTEQARSVIDPA